MRGQTLNSNYGYNRNGICRLTQEDEIEYENMGNSSNRIKDPKEPIGLKNLKLWRANAFLLFKVFIVIKRIQSPNFQNLIRLDSLLKFFLVSLVFT